MRTLLFLFIATLAFGEIWAVKQKSTGDLVFVQGNAFDRPGAGIKSYLNVDGEIPVNDLQEVKLTQAEIDAINAEKVSQQTAENTMKQTIKGKFNALGFTNAELKFIFEKLKD